VCAEVTRPDELKYIEPVRQKYYGSIRGLTVGAPVDFRGLLVGEVSRIDLSFNQDKVDFAMQVEISLYPDRFAERTRNYSGRQVSEKASRDILDRMVAKGFRAQMRTGNVLTGQRYIALDFFPKATTGRVDWSKRRPELPVQPGTLDSLQDQLLTIVDSLRHTLLHVDQLVVKLDREVAPELATTLRDARKTALDEAAQEAKALGADAVIGVDLDYEVLGQGGSMLMVTASGTAVMLG